MHACIDELTARGPLARPEHGRPGTAQARHGPEVTWPGPGTARALGRAWAASSACRAARHGPPKRPRPGPARPLQRSACPSRPPPRLPTVGSERAAAAQAARLPAPAQNDPALYDPAGAPSPTLTLIPIHSRPALAPACDPLRRRSDSAVARRASPRWTSPRRLVLHRRVTTSSSPLYPSPSPRPRPFAHLCPPRRRHPRRRPPSSLSSSISPAPGSGFAGKYILLKTSTPLSNPSCLTLTLTLATSSSQ